MSGEVRLRRASDLRPELSFRHGARVGAGALYPRSMRMERSDARRADNARPEACSRSQASPPASRGPARFGARW
jgi:hypothetical protein